PVPAEIEAVAVDLDGLGDPADLLVRLEHDRAVAARSERERPREARRAAAENRVPDRCRLHLCSPQKCALARHLCPPLTSQLSPYEPSRYVSGWERKGVGLNQGYTSSHTSWPLQPLMGGFGPETFASSIVPLS